MDIPPIHLLVFGHTGQVATALRLGSWPGVTVTTVPRGRADLTDADAVARAVRAVPCDLVVNAAAHTAVDRAEGEPELAFAVNRDGVRHLAAACAAAGRPLLHLSTDYVFDGTKDGAYTEDDPVRPLGVYGASKAAGEEALRTVLDRHLILRVSWLFGPHGQNFVRTMLRLGRERDMLRVVADQTGSPTATPELAGLIVALARRIAAGDTAWGTWHVCGGPATSWHGFAMRVFEERHRLTGRPPPVVTAIATAEFPTPARRPANSRLDGTRLADRFGLVPLDWRTALSATVDTLDGALDGALPAG